MTQYSRPHIVRDEREDNLAEEEEIFHGRYDADELNELELENVKRELVAEVNELEWEFKLAKETLFNERIAQVEAKLTQARSALAPEFFDVSALVEEAYRIRRQVVKYRRDFALEEANKEVDIQLLSANCDASERRLNAEEKIRANIEEAMYEIEFEKRTRKLRKSKDLRSNGELKQTPKATSGDATLSGHKQPSALTLPIAYNSPRSVSPIPVSQSSFSPSVAVAPSPIGSFSSTSTSTSNSLSCQVSHMASTSYLPGPDLAPRKRPVILLQSVPHIIYQLPEHIIEADAAYFNKAVQDRIIERHLFNFKKQRFL